MEDLEGLNILVTGSAGFVGSNVVRGLAEQGAMVTATHRPGSNLWRLRDLPENVHRIALDVTDRDAVRVLLRSTGPDGVIHAATHGAYGWQNESEKILEGALHGTINVVDATLRETSAWLINTGSSSEYGAKSQPMSESDVLEPISVYGVAKAAATLYVQAVARRARRHFFTLRLFSPYGPFEDPRRLVPSLILAHFASTAPMLGSPDSVRDFVHTDDVVEAVAGVVLHRESLSDGCILNVGSGKMYSVREVVDVLGEVVGHPLHVEWGTRRSTDVVETKAWVADVSRARRLIEWQPRTGLGPGLAKCVDWFRDHRELYDT